MKYVITIEVEPDSPSSIIDWDEPARCVACDGIIPSSEETLSVNASGTYQWHHPRCRVLLDSARPS